MGKPRVIKENNSARIVIEIDCQSKTQPDVTFSHNGADLQNKGRHLIDVYDAKGGVFILVLEIDDVVPEDAGSYKCVARNAKGESQTTFDVKLDGPAEKKEPAAPAAAAKPAEAAKPKSDEVAPTFKEKPKDQVGIDGDKITVSCKIAGTPKPEITWYKNKQVIKKSKASPIFYHFYLQQSIKQVLLFF